jgi:succinoglycan biosynthesis transport protein ExoP
MNLPDRPPVGRGMVVRDHGVAPPLVYAPPQPPPQDFVETVRKLWRHRYLIAVCTLAAGAVAALAAANLPTRYAAEARVLVGVPEVRVLNIEAIINSISPTAERVQNETFIMQSRILAQQVIDRLNLAGNPEFNPDLWTTPTWRQYLDIKRYIPDSWLPEKAESPLANELNPAQRLREQMTDILLSRVDVSTLGRSHVLSVVAQAQDPLVATAIANTLATSYLRQQKQDKEDATTQAEQFLNNRIAELRQQVEKSDQAVEEYRRAHGLYRGSNNSGVTSQQLTELNTQLILAQTAKAEADSRLREAEVIRKSGSIGESAPDVLRSPLIMALKQQQAETERRMADMSQNFGEQHPKMASARAEIGDTRRKIGTEVSRIIEGLRHEANASGARYGALKGNFEQLKRQMGGVNESSIQLDALERDATVNRKLLESVLSRARETIGQQQLQTPDARLISPAAPSERPSFPPKALILFLGTLGGLLIGLLVAVLRESMDRTYRLAEQVEMATGLPVLSLVPNLRGHMAPTVHVLRRPVSPFSEALRKVYIGLQLSETERAPKVVQVSSATPGEGKTVLVASLGRMLASNGRRVLVIDCDWRRPSLHRSFSVENRGGLASLLSEDEIALERIIHNDPLSGLDVIPAGKLRPQDSHLLTSDRMRSLVKTCAKNYDLVLLDTPPVLVGAEVLALSRIADKVVFAIRWGKTRRETALDALRQLVGAQADVAGIVLSRVDAKLYREYAYGHLNYQYVRPAFSILR